jgi:serine/threonine protein kinase
MRLLDWPERRHIIYGIAQGLIYLHEYSEITVIHLNIKPYNILLDHDMNPKIRNFDISRILRSGVTEDVEGDVYGTP